MMSSKLEKIQNGYYSALGQIERDYELVSPPNPVEKKWVGYKLNVRTLFMGFQIFLTANESALKKEYLDFFRLVTAKGAPEHAMVCATAYLANSSKESKSQTSMQAIEDVCDAWQINIHEVLQFAIIEYLTDMSQLGKETWHAVTKTLLQLKIDPNYSTNKFKNILSQHQWTLPATELNSAFNILIATPKITDDVRELAVDFAAQQEKIGSKLTIRSDQVEPLFPKISKRESFRTNAWFQWLEKNFPERVKEYVVAHQKAMIYELADNKDFTTLDYFFTHYNLDPFVFLIERGLAETKTVCVESQTFQYLEKSFPEKLLNYIKTNNERFVTRFSISELADAGMFSMIDNYIKRYGIDPFPALIAKEQKQTLGSCINSPVFQYLEKTFKDRLLDYIKQNNNVFIHRFLLSELAAQKNFDQIDQLRTRYSINPFIVFLKPRDEIICWQDDPGFQYLESKDFDQLKNYIKWNSRCGSGSANRSKLMSLAANNEFKKLDIWREKYEIDFFDDLFDCLISLDKKKETPWVEMGLFKYLEKHYPERFAAGIKWNDYSIISDLGKINDYTSLGYLIRNYQFKIDIKMLMKNISDDTIFKGNVSIWGNRYEVKWEYKSVCDHHLFKWLNEVCPQEIGKYFLDNYQLLLL